MLRLSLKKIHRLAQTESWVTQIDCVGNLAWKIYIHVEQLDADMEITYNPTYSYECPDARAWQLSKVGDKDWNHPNLTKERFICMIDEHAGVDIIIRRIYQLICFPNFRDPMQEMTLHEYYGQYNKAPIQHFTDASVQIHYRQQFNDGNLEYDDEDANDYEDEDETLHDAEYEYMRGIQQLEAGNLKQNIEHLARYIWWGLGSPRDGFSLDIWLTAEREIRCNQQRFNLFHRLGHKGSSFTIGCMEEMSDRHKAISNLAYCYWEELKQPKGEDTAIWLLAESEWEVIEARRKLMERRTQKPMTWKRAYDWYTSNHPPFANHDMEDQLSQWFS